MLLFESAFMLPLTAALVAGDIVATEDGNGTLKTILTRSVDRGQVFAAKALAAMTYATIAVFLSAAVATIAGVASWGFNHVTTFSGTVVAARRRPAAGVRRQRLLPDPAGRDRQHRRAAVDRHAQQRRGRRRHARAYADPRARDRQIPGLEGITALPADDRVQQLARPAAHANRLGADLALGCGSARCTPCPALLAAYLVFLRRDVAGG